MLHEASEFNANDLLVHLNLEHCYSFQNEAEIAWEQVRKIIIKSQNLIKESGVNPLCIAKGSIKWERSGTIIESPLLLFPVSFKHNKVTKNVELTVDEEAVLLNPFVEKHLKTAYAITQDAPKSLNELAVFLSQLGFENIDVSSSELGNFHHHRYELLKELEELSLISKYPISLEEILGISNLTNNQSDFISTLELLPADDDHRNAFLSFEKRNLVVQGPPGTGKSQFLTNLIGKSLISQNSIVVISEKRSALEVIESKLKDLKLDHLSFISTPDLNTRDFMHSLKKSWLYFEEFQGNKNPTVSVKKELESDLQMTLNLLNQNQLIGGISYSQFHKLTKSVDLSKITFQSRVPNLVLVQDNVELLESIYSKKLNQLIGTIQVTVIVNNHWNQIADNLEELKLTSSELLSKFDVKTWEDISKLMQRAVVCQLFENTLVEKHSHILKADSKEQKQFIKLATTYQSLIQQKNQLPSLSAWKLEPSIIEVESIIEQLNSGFWSKRKATKRWGQLNHLPIQKASLAYTELKERIDLEHKLSKTESQLLQLGLTDIAQETPQLQNAIPLFTKDKWYEYSQLSAEQKREIIGFQIKLDRYRVMIKHYFSFDEDLAIFPFFESLEKYLHLIIEQSSQLKNLDSDCLYALKSNNTFKEFLSNVSGSHWSNFKNNYPSLSQFEIGDLALKINAILGSENLEQEIIVETINNSVSIKFKQYNQLLSVPASKLSDIEKEQKKRLRKGKAILVKEFAKTKSHPSLRELFSSDAREWIQLLVPIWLSNPSQLAKCFPLQESLFDHCVFDEASQLLLHNSVGAIYRSKRIIVAGDDQQMGPTSFFQAGSDEKISLLQQANHYLERVTLRHHYRSQHPELINFSNKHFYNNELKVFPSFGSTHNVIEMHKVEEGKFIDRQNIPEAKKAAELISFALKSKQTIGVVAFSKDQVNCIWSSLSEADKIKFEDRIDKNEAFLKPLEKVQGDECEHLIISMAYGANEDGEFNLRMGPLNRSSGRNRLNVLFSRASKRIDFICSVEASDFKLSENESINLLRDWLRYITEKKLRYITEKKLRYITDCKSAITQQIVFPFDLDPIIDGNSLKFESIQDTITSANELVTIHRVLSNRGWEISYQ